MGVKPTPKLISTSSQDSYPASLYERHRSSALLNLFGDTRLGSMEDAYLCIMTAWNQCPDPPKVHVDLDHVQAMLVAYKRDKRWTEAEEVLESIYAGPYNDPGSRRIFMEFGDLYRSMALQEDKLVQMQGWGNSTYEERKRDHF